jgi:hypothetical protein
MWIEKIQDMELLGKINKKVVFYIPDDGHMVGRNI